MRHVFFLDAILQDAIASDCHMSTIWIHWILPGGHFWHLQVNNVVTYCPEACQGKTCRVGLHVHYIHRSTTCCFYECTERTLKADNAEIMGGLLHSWGQPAQDQGQAMHDYMQVWQDEEERQAKRDLRQRLAL